MCTSRASATCCVRPIEPAVFLPIHSLHNLPEALNIHWEALPFEQLPVTSLYAALQLRAEVFVVEQRCAYQDPDGHDASAMHLMGWDSPSRSTLLAYTRLLPPGVTFSEASIGRVVTSPVTRGTGLGHRLMAQSLNSLFEHWGKQDVRIGAQAHLQAFYQQHGFVTEGEPYVEDGIPHVEMIRRAG